MQLPPAVAGLHSRLNNKHALGGWIPAIPAGMTITARFYDLAEESS